MHHISEIFDEKNLDFIDNDYNAFVNAREKFCLTAAVKIIL